MNHELTSHAEIASDLVAVAEPDCVRIFYTKNPGYIPLTIPMESLEDSEYWIMERWAKHNNCLKEN